MTDAKSHYSVDASVQPFLQPNFDPADYLNSTLPPSSFSSTATKPGARTAALADLSTQLQTLLTQLNTHTTRLSNTLTQLTDEIVRSGSRLAYEVEVLRGETLSLDDALHNDLKSDLTLLSLSDPVAEPVQSSEPPKDSASSAAEAGAEGTSQETATLAPTAPAQVSASEPQSQDPYFLSRLRTLTTVRERLDAVIKIFGAAMAWPIAPSELSLASSFISISAPENSGEGDNSAEGREARARAHAEDLRREVVELLASGGQEGVEAAAARVEGLRLVAGVWKGTSEEKARLKLVDGLQKLVDDRAKALGRATAFGGVGEGRKQGNGSAAATPARGIDYRYGGLDTSRLTGEGIGGYGFLQNLKNFKNDVYLE